MEAPARAKILREGYSYAGAAHTLKPGTKESCELLFKRRLIFELSCYKQTISAKLIPDAALVCKILQEKLAVETI